MSLYIYLFFSLWIYSRLGSSAYARTLCKYCTGQDKKENVSFYIMKFRTMWIFCTHRGDLEVFFATNTLEVKWIWLSSQYTYTWSTTVTASEGVVESQFGRLERKLSTLPTTIPVRYLVWGHNTFHKTFNLIYEKSYLTDYLWICYSCSSKVLCMSCRNLIENMLHFSPFSQGEILWKYDMQAGVKSYHAS